MSIPADTCDVCGTPKKYAPVLGAYCPNEKCGGTETPETIVEKAPPPNGRFVKLSSKSVQIALEEKLRAEQPMLAKVDAIDLFVELADGSQRQAKNVLLQVKHPKPNLRPGPSRIAVSAMHPKGITIKLATRDGVDIR